MEDVVQQTLMFNPELILILASSRYRTLSLRSLMMTSLTLLSQDLTLIHICMQIEQNTYVF